jgi:muconolactone delta-isomerase
MLYHIDVDIDYAALGARRDEILKAEWAVTENLMAQGIALAEWRKASGRGVIAVWDCESHAKVNEILRSLPLAPYLTKVEVIPLVDHPMWPNGRLKFANSNEAKTP